MRPTVITISAWGSPWVERAERETLACLMAQSHIESGDVLVHYATSDGPGISPRIVERLSAMGASVTIENIGSLPNPRDLHEVAVRNGFALACRLGADWLNFCADHVFPSGYLRAAKEALTADRIVVGTSIRATREGMFAEFGDFRKPRSGADLLGAALRNVHPKMLDYFMTDPVSEAPANPHHCFFTTDDGFACYQSQPAIFAINCDGLELAMVEPGRCFDLGILGVALGRNEPVRFIDEMPSEFTLVSLDDESGVTTFGSFPVTPETVGEFTRTLGMPERHAQWMLAHRTLYRCPPHVCAGLPATIDEGAAMARVREVVG
jgi:hypothetical protein